MIIRSLIAAIYIGFAVGDGRARVIAVESGVATIFVVIAAAAVTGSPAGARRLELQGVSIEMAQCTTPREWPAASWELAIGSWELGINFKSPVFDSLSSEE